MGSTVWLHDPQQHRIGLDPKMHGEGAELVIERGIPRFGDQRTPSVRFVIDYGGGRQGRKDPVLTDRDWFNAVAAAIQHGLLQWSFEAED